MRGVLADPELESFKTLKLEDTYFDKNVEKTFVAVSKNMFAEKVEPTLLMAKMIGNMYCGSLYGCLASLLSQRSDQLV